MKKILLLSSLVILSACTKDITAGNHVRFEKASSCFYKVEKVLDDGRAEVTNIQTNSKDILGLEGYVVCEPSDEDKHPVGLKTNIGGLPEVKGL